MKLLFVKWLLIFFLGIIIVPTFAQSTSINQTDYQKLESSINAMQTEYQKLQTSISGLQIEHKQINKTVNDLHTDHVQYDSSSRVLTALTFVGGGLIALVFFYVQSIQSKNIETMTTKIKDIITKQDELVKDVHSFAEEQKKIKEIKRKRYANGILGRLELIDFEVEGLFISTAFLKNAISDSDKSEQKENILKKYERAQWLFIDMKIEYDTMLEVFDNSVEVQYVNAYRTISGHKDIWEYNLEDVNVLETTIEKIRNEFKKFKDLITQFVPSESRSRYEKLFVLEIYNRIISQIPSSSQDNTRQDSEPRS